MLDTGYLNPSFLLSYLQNGEWGRPILNIKQAIKSIWSSYQSLESITPWTVSLQQVYNRVIKPKYAIFWHFLETSACVDYTDDIFIANGWPT